jgi:hypothetical protein
MMHVIKIVSSLSFITVSILETTYHLFEPRMIIVVGNSKDISIETHCWGARQWSIQRVENNMWQKVGPTYLNTIHWEYGPMIAPSMPSEPC